MATIIFSYKSCIRINTCLDYKPGVSAHLYASSQPRQLLLVALTLSLAAASSLNLLTDATSDHMSKSVHMHDMYHTGTTIFQSF